MTEATDNSTKKHEPSLTGDAEMEKLLLLEEKKRLFLFKTRGRKHFQVQGLIFFLLIFYKLDLEIELH